MTQCAGKTRKGERCKREAREGSIYCSIHREQEAHPRPEAKSQDPDFVLKAALGLAALAAIVLFRIRR
jgi:MYXO-CTERM domain-containing protein